MKNPPRRRVVYGWRWAVIGCGTDRERLGGLAGGGCRSTRASRAYRDADGSSTKRYGQRMTGADMERIIEDMCELRATLPPRHTLHCHPSVTAALALKEPEPSWQNPGRMGALVGIDVFEEPEMMPGAWEIREGDKLVTFGVLRRPES